LSFGAGTAAEEGEEGGEELVMVKEEGDGGGTNMEGFKMVACRATGFVPAVVGGTVTSADGRNPFDSIHRRTNPTCGLDRVPISR
jgi:hypothetical protein